MGNLSQDSFFAHSTGLGVPPPPLPPRPRLSQHMSNFSPDDDDAEDPDYAYIKEDEVEGPKSNASAKKAVAGATKKTPSATVDDVLNELEQDIIRDNRVKKVQQRRRAQTIGRSPMRVAPPPPLSIGPHVTFPKVDPQDYTDFVPAKRSHTKSTSSEPEKTNTSVSHMRSVSEPDPRPLTSPSQLLSQPAPVFEGNEEMEQRPQPSSVHAPSDYSHYQPGIVPTLPPRTWRHASTSSYTSTGSTSNLGNDLTGSVSSSITAGERGVVSCGEGMSPTFEGVSGLSDESAGDKPVSPVSGENLVSIESKPAMKGNKRTSLILDKENKTPPTTIPEETTPPQPQSSPEAEGHGQTTPPPLPPRSPTKEKLSRKSSTSSTSSVSSNGRCPRCRSARKPKSSVGKTFSLDQRAASSAAKDPSEDCRKSLPDLADADAVPENSLEGKGHRHIHRSREHSHCSKCSPVSSTDTLHGNDSGHSLRSTSLQNFDYLQLVGEEQKGSSSTSSIDNELRPEMDLLNSCLQTLEYLEQKVNGTSSSGGTTSMVSNSSPSSSSSYSTTTSSSGSQWATMGTKVKAPQVKAPQGDTKKSVYMQARKEAQQVLADLSQPLASPHVLGKTMPFSTDVKKSPSNSHASYLGKQSPSAYHPRAKGGHLNGTRPPPQRSSTSIGLTTPPMSLAHIPSPPVPPRSMVSLTQPVANSSPTQITSSHNKTQSRSATQLHPQATTPTTKSGYNRSISSGHMGHHHTVRNVSTRPSHATPIRGHPSLIRHQRLNHTEGSGQSSTVFIHHIKDSRVDSRVGGLTHLV